jgi:hypothetical protein
MHGAVLEPHLSGHWLAALVLTASTSVCQINSHILSRIFLKTQCGLRRSADCQKGRSLYCQARLEGCSAAVPSEPPAFPQQSVDNNICFK